MIRFRPHWKLLFIPFLWFLALSVAMIIVAMAFDWLQWVVLLVLAGFLVYFVVRPLVAWWTTRYVLTTERLITRRGLIAKSGVAIPLERITNVNFNQTVFERILGAGDLLVEAAGTTGQSKFSDIPHPDDFQALLYRVREQRTIALSGSPAAAPSGGTQADSIRELAKLRDEGLITDEEYEAKRQELLDGM